MKKLLLLILALVMLCQTFALAGCSQSSSTDGAVVFEGVASCERVNRIDVRFRYYAGRQCANNFVFEMEPRKVHYIEGTDYPEGTTVSPKFIGKVSYAKEDIPCVKGESFTVYHHGYALEIVEIGADYALGYLSFVKLDTENSDRAGTVDFGIMDIVLTRDGRKKYIPEDWQARLHAHEPGPAAAQLAQSDLDETVKKAIESFKEDRYTALTAYGDRGADPIWRAAVQRAAQDTALSPVDRAWAMCMLIYSNALNEEEQIQLYEDVLALLSLDPASARDVMNIFDYPTPSESSLLYSYIDDGMLSALIDSVGVEGVLDMLPTAESYAASGMGDDYEYVMQPFADALKQNIADADAVLAASRYAVDTGRMTLGIMSVTFTVCSEEDAVTLVEEQVAHGAIDIDPGELFAAFMDGCHFSGADQALSALNTLRTQFPGAVLSRSIERFHTVRCPSLDAKLYSAPAIMEESSPLPAGRVLPVLCSDGETSLFVSMLAPRDIYTDDTVPDIPESAIPASIEEADILVAFTERSEFYAPYTNNCKGYLTVVDMNAYDMKTGEWLAYLGSESFYPPSSFTGVAGSSVYGQISYNILYESFCLLFADAAPAEETPANTAPEETPAG